MILQSKGLQNVSVKDIKENLRARVKYREGKAPDCIFITPYGCKFCEYNNTFIQIGNETYGLCNFIHYLVMEG